MPWSHGVGSTKSPKYEPRIAVRKPAGMIRREDVAFSAAKGTRLSFSTEHAEALLARKQRIFHISQLVGLAQGDNDAVAVFVDSNSTTYYFLPERLTNRKKQGHEKAGWPFL